MGLRRQFYILSCFIRCSILSTWVLWHYRWVNTCTPHTIPETVLPVFLSSCGRGNVIFEKLAYFGTVSINSKYYQLAFIYKLSVWICWSLSGTYTMCKYIQYWQPNHLKKFSQYCTSRRCVRWLAEAIRAVVIFQYLSAYKLPESYLLNFQIVV